MEQARHQRWMEMMNRDVDERSVTAWRLAVAGLMGMLAFGTVVSTAFAEGGNMRYSYEEARIAGERQFVLVPRAEDGLAGEVTTDRLEQAFEALRTAKRPTYGNSYAVASGSVPDDVRVEVHIDSDYEDYAPIIMAEAVYTLTEYGVPEVFFPGHSEEGLTRADISFAAYTLTVPLWKMVPPGAVTMAQVVMPNGELVAVDDVNRRWDEEREAVIDDVYAFLNSDDPYTIRSVVRGLADIGDLRLSEVTPFLEHRDRRVRRSTLGILEGFEDDRDVLEAVLAALDEESSRSLGRSMAEFLGASPHDEFNVQKPFFLIEYGDDEEAEQAVLDLADWDEDERVVEVLDAALRDEREEVAMAAVRSLDELELHAQRDDALRDASVSAPVRQQISEDLAAGDNEPSVRLMGLRYIARERTGGYANQAIATMAELPIDEAREEVEKYLVEGSLEQRRTAIQVLQARNEIASVAALMEAAKQGSPAEAMQQAAYAIMVNHPLDEIIAQTEAESIDVQKVAYQAIGERANREGERERSVETIDEAIGHPEAEIRGAAARSLGQIGGEEALETLGEMTDDAEPVVRREVALALGQFSGTDHAQTLVEYLDDEDPRVVAAAIDAMEQRGDQREADAIREMVDHEEAVIRASAIRAATTFLPDDEDAMRQHMGLLSGVVSDDAVQVQKATLEQLGRFEDSMAVTNIATQIRADDPMVRIAAVRALADTGHDDALPLLESALSDDDAMVRQEAVEALTDLAGSAARSELEERREHEEDPEVLELIETRLQEI